MHFPRRPFCEARSAIFSPVSYIASHFLKSLQIASKEAYSSCPWKGAFRPHSLISDFEDDPKPIAICYRSQESLHFRKPLYRIFHKTLHPYRPPVFSGFGPVLFVQLLLDFPFPCSFLFIQQLTFSVIHGFTLIQVLLDRFCLFVGSILASFLLLPPNSASASYFHPQFCIPLSIVLRSLRSATTNKTTSPRVMTSPFVLRYRICNQLQAKKKPKVSLGRVCYRVSVAFKDLTVALKNFLATDSRAVEK